MNVPRNCFALASLLLVFDAMTWRTASREPQLTLFVVASVFILTVSLYWYLFCPSATAQVGEPKLLPRSIHIAIVLAAVALSVEAIVSYALVISSDPGYTNYGGDMIPRVFYALRRVLNDRPMYDLSSLPPAYLATHLPGLTLGFLPAALLHIDIRFIGALYYGVLLFGMCALISSPDSSKATTFFIVPLIGFFALPGLVRLFLPGAHTPLEWLTVFGFCLAIHRGRYVVASMILAMMLFIRETSLLIAAFYAIHLFKTHGARISAIHLTLIGAANVVLWIPFFDAEGVLELIHTKTVSPAVSWADPAKRIGVLNTIGFSNLFYLAGLGNWLRPVMLLGLLASTAYFMRSSGSRQKLFFGCAASLLWFYYLCGQPVAYIYIPVPIFWVFGLLSARSDTVFSNGHLVEAEKVIAGVKIAKVLPILVLGCAVLMPLVAPRYRDPVEYDFARNRQEIRGLVYERETYADGDFVWGGEGSISFDYPLRDIVLPERLNIIFIFKMRPYTCAGLKEQVVEILSNHEHVAHVVLKPGWQEYRVEVPSSSLYIGTNRFTLVPAFASPPKSCGEDDDRLLSVAYDYMVIDGATSAVVR